MLSSITGSRHVVQEMAGCEIQQSHVKANGLCLMGRCRLEGHFDGPKCSMGKMRRGKYVFRQTKECQGNDDYDTV